MLPESQLDRFMVCMSIGYPKPSEEIDIIRSRRASNPLEQVVPALEEGELVHMQEEVTGIFIHDEIYQYIADLADATRNSELLELGISPRGSLSLSRMVQARAYLKGRQFVIPDDVASVFTSVAVHRVRVSTKAKLNRMSEEDVLAELLKEVPKPSPEKGMS